METVQNIYPSQCFFSAPLFAETDFERLYGGEPFSLLLLFGRQKETGSPCLFFGTTTSFRGRPFRDPVDPQASNERLDFDVFCTCISQPFFLRPFLVAAMISL